MITFFIDVLSMNSQTVEEDDKDFDKNKEDWQIHRELEAKR